MRSRRRRGIAILCTVHTTTDTIETPWGQQRIFVRFSREVPAEAPVVVLVHGLGVSSRYMLPLMRELGAYANVFAPDLPGFGRSQKPAASLNMQELADVLAAWMKGRAFVGVSLVGNSMGCQVAVNLAQRHPDLPACLVLVGPTMDDSASPARQVLRWLSMAFVEPLSLIPVVIRDYLSAGFMRTLRTFRFALQDKIHERLMTIAHSVVVVRGSRDRIVTATWATTVAGRAQKGRLVTVPMGGHAVNYDSPRALARIIRCVLRQLRQS